MQPTPKSGAPGLGWSLPEITEKFEMSLATLRLVFPLFKLFDLLLWMWIILNYTKQKHSKTYLYKKKVIVQLTF